MAHIKMSVQRLQPTAYTIYCLAVVGAVWWCTVILTNAKPGGQYSTTYKRPTVAAAQKLQTKDSFYAAAVKHKNPP